MTRHDVQAFVSDSTILEKYKAKGVICFAHHPSFYEHLYHHRYQRLAELYVDLESDPCKKKSRKDIVALLIERLTVPPRWLGKPYVLQEELSWNDRIGLTIMPSLFIGRDSLHFGGAEHRGKPRIVTMMHQGCLYNAKAVLDGVGTMPHALVELARKALTAYDGF